MSEWIRTGSVPLSLKSSLDGNFPGLSLKKRRSCPWQFHSPQLTSGSALLDLINRDLSVHRKSARSSLQECKQCYKRWNGLFHSNSKEALEPLHSPWWRCPHRSEITFLQGHYPHCWGLERGHLERRYYGKLPAKWRSGCVVLCYWEKQ